MQMMNREQTERFFSLPLSIRSNKYQLLWLGFGWKNVNLFDYRINGDNLYKRERRDKIVNQQTDRSLLTVTLIYVSCGGDKGAGRQGDRRGTGDGRGEGGKGVDTQGGRNWDKMGKTLQHCITF